MGIRRHFLAERRGLQIIRNYFPNLGVVYPLLRIIVAEKDKAESPPKRAFT